jgi:hypothetical protein
MTPPAVYDIAASVLMALEIVDVWKIYSRGLFLGHNDWTHFAMASYQSNNASPGLQADLQLLTDWIGIAKGIVVVGLVGSILSNEPRVRATMSVGFTLVLSTYYLVMGPSLHKVVELGELSDWHANLDSYMAVVLGAFALGAALEVKAALSPLKTNKD